MKRTDPQMKLRLPPDLKDMISAAAEVSRQTLSGEIIERLKWSFANELEFAEHRIKTTAASRRAAQKILEMGAPQNDLQAQIDELRHRVDKLERR